LLKVAAAADNLLIQTTVEMVVRAVVAVTLPAREHRVKVTLAAIRESVAAAVAVVLAESVVTLVLSPVTVEMVSTLTHLGQVQLQLEIVAITQAAAVAAEKILAV
jgi:hypothetical protein